MKLRQRENEKQSMQLQSLRFNGTKTGTAYIVPAMMKRLTPETLFMISLTLAGDNHCFSGGEACSGRNYYLPLNNQFSSSGAEIKAIRIKGFLPVDKGDGDVSLHRGGGYVRHPIETNGKGDVFHGPPPVGQPEMGAFAENAELEFSVARQLGPRLTDHGIGYGIFDNLAHHGEKIGFTIFGQEHEKDLRFFDGYGMVIRNIRLPYQLGGLLARFHQTHIHGYPHLGNIGKIPRANGRMKLIMRDLESVKPLNSLPPPQRFTSLFLDLYKIIKEFDTYCAFETDYTDVMAFMRGYFRPDFTFNPDEVLKFVLDFNFQFDTIKLKGYKFNLPEYLAKSPLRFSSFLYQRLSVAAGMS